jgi:hypothetical protein
MSVETMTQCRLTRDKEIQILWLPTKFATENRRVGLREKTPQGGAYWDEGWVVDEIYNTLPESYVIERSQDYKKTREASDI